MDEVRELDLGDRPQPVDRGTDRRPDDHRLGERRVDHAVVAELRPQAVGREEDASLLADVLAQDHDRLVAAHLLGHPVADRLDERPDRHQPCPPARRPVPRRRRLAGPVLAVDPVRRALRVRVRLRLGVVRRVVDDRAELGRERGLHLVGQDARLEQLRAEDRQRVVGLALRELVLGAVLRLLVVGRVRGEPGHLRLDEGRAAAASRAVDGLAARRIAGEDVGAVHDDAGDPVAGRAHGDVLDRQLLLGRDADRVAVVLDDEHERQLVDRGEVERLVDVALV